MSTTLMRPVWYEPHPITPARKAELREQGYVVRDAAFAPPAAEAPAQAAKPATVAELKAALNARNVPFDEHAKKPELQALFDALT